MRYIRIFTLLGIITLIGCENLAIASLKQFIEDTVEVANTPLIQPANVIITSADAQIGESLDSDYINDVPVETTITLTATLNGSRKVQLSAPGVVFSPAKIINSGGISTFVMPPVDVEIQADFSYLEIPADPTDLNVVFQAQNKSAIVSWTDESNNEDGFRIYSDARYVYSTLLGGYLVSYSSSPVPVKDVPTNFTSTVIDLVPSDANIDVKAFNDEGVSGSANPIY